MAKQFHKLDPDLRAFIERQRIFFVASATAESRVNVSPREIGALRIVNEQNVIYLDRTGSGNETAAHMIADGRLTIMLCAFDGPPRIMRLYGRGRSLGWQTKEFREIIRREYAGEVPLGTRQIVSLQIELVQTSCGNGVPLFDFKSDRAAIENWHNSLGPAGIHDYWEEKNLQSIDGLPTGLLIPDE